MNQGGPPPKTKYSSVTDSELVGRPKGEKNPSEGSEKDLKPHAYKLWEHYGALRHCVTAYLLHNGAATCSLWRG